MSPAYTVCILQVPESVASESERETDRLIVVIIFNMKGVQVRICLWDSNNADGYKVEE